MTYSLRQRCGCSLGGGGSGLGCSGVGGGGSCGGSCGGGGVSGRLHFLIVHCGSGGGGGSVGSSGSGSGCCGSSGSGGGNHRLIHNRVTDGSSVVGVTTAHLEVMWALGDLRVKDGLTKAISKC